MRCSRRARTNRCSRSGDSLALVPPTWRRDLVDPYDYVEEVGRKIGFDAIPSIVPAARAGAGLTRGQRARRAITGALAGVGFVEELMLPFMSADDLESLNETLHALRTPGIAAELAQADADYAIGNTVSGEELRRRYGLK